MPLLLAFLKDGPQAASDFYVRYHTVQLLTALAAGGPYRLQKVSQLTRLPVALCGYANLLCRVAEQMCMQAALGAQLLDHQLWHSSVKALKSDYACFLN